MSTNFQTATLAGGCFWCIEAIFKELKGVERVVSGYTGGTTENPSYDDLHNKNTGHAEAIQITFDPTVITYDQLLEIFWHFHDPTTRNRQGADTGAQYRSAIYYHDKKQHENALASKQQLDESGTYEKPAVTEIVPFTRFYPAEDYHQDYYRKNSAQPYCLFVIDPKLARFREQYKMMLK